MVINKTNCCCYGYRITKSFPPWLDRFGSASLNFPKSLLNLRPRAGRASQNGSNDMHHSTHSSVFLATMAIACAGLISCAQDDLVNPGLNIGEQTDVQSATQAATIAGPSAATAESMIVGLMSLDPMCPATVDLGNGVTGTCSTTGGDAAFTFAGTLMVDGASAAVNGTLTVTLAAGQPSTGGPA